MTKQKHFRFYDEEIEIINSVMRDEKIKSESAALRFIIQSYNKDQNAMNHRSSKENAIQLKILREQEDKLDILLDAVNTILQTGNLQSKNCVPLDVLEASLITESKEYKKNRLTELKQKKDSKVR